MSIESSIVNFLKTNSEKRMRVKKPSFSLAIVTAFFLCFFQSINAQDLTTRNAAKEVAQSSIKKSDFSKSVIKAAVECQKKGEITRLELIRLRVAMLSPSMQSKIEDLAVMELASSGIENAYSLDSSGKIDRQSIDWEQLLKFLEKLVPIILELIKLFS
jgi:hypothetical protein